MCLPPLQRETLWGLKGRGDLISAGISEKDHDMWIIVCYDVNTETSAGRRRLRRVAQVCKNFGQRVQKSVFECQVDEMKFEQLRRRLLKEVELELDNLRIYRLTEPRDKHVEEFGATRTIFYDEETLVV